MPKKITYYTTLLSAISLPAKTPVKRYWQRTNGRDTLIIKAGEAPLIENNKIVRDRFGEPIPEELKLPSGIIPRHIFCFLSYEWTLKKNKTFMLGNSFHDFLKKMNKSSGGKQYQIMKDQIRRLFYCSIGALKETDRGFKQKIPSPIIDNIKVFWSDMDDQEESILPSSITISDYLADILCRSLPLNHETIQSIGKNVLAYDLYCWLNYRHYSLSDKFTISYEALHQQFGSDYKQLRDFKSRLQKAFNLISDSYIHNSKITENGILLVPSKTDINPKIISSAKLNKLLNK